MGGALVAVAGAVVYARWIEPRWLQLRHRRIHVRGLPQALEGLRMGLLTDLHAGEESHYRLIRRAVGMLNRERPDIVALTGDFAADDAQGFDEVLDALDGLRAPLGVYAVPGNHDYVVGIDLWREAMERHPFIQDLTNQYRLLKHGAVRLCVAGVDDYYEGSPRLRLPPPDQRDFTLLLAHSPDEAERVRRAYDAVNLIVSGHTHGGQVRLPFLPAPINSAERSDLYEEGLRRRPWTQVYTSRGLGTVHLPLRFFARPEVAVLELTGASRPVWRRGLLAERPARPGASAGTDSTPAMAS